MAFGKGKKDWTVAKKSDKKMVGPQQVYLVSSLPGIGTKLATRLLEAFRTPRVVFSANRCGIARVQGIGRTKAFKIEMALDTEYGELKSQISKPNSQTSW